MSDFLWVEKYRPKKISDCILTEDLKNTFTQFLKQKEIPNLLLSGTAGTGKTTVAKALCEELGAEYVYYTGLQSKAEKDDNKDRFQDDPNCRIIIANQAAGGTGLTLTAANYEYKYSRGFKLGDELQSDSRAYRGGQKRQTTCVNFVVRDSIEEKCVARLREKAEHAEDILAKNDFSRNEILGMI